MKTKLHIASRRSSLALIQTLSVISNLNNQTIEPSVTGVKTLGDIELEKELYNITSNQTKSIEKALFTKELDNYLLKDLAQLAVHSLKDVPTKLPNTLSLLESYLESQSNDILIIKKSSLRHMTQEYIEPNTKLSIASSSRRRISLLKYYFPNFQIFNIRGNIITRLYKLLEDDTLDATLLAAAGLNRIDSFFTNIQNQHNQIALLELSLQENIYNDAKRYQDLPFEKLLFYKISEKDFPPAVGQGIISIQTNQSGKLSLEKNLKIKPDHFLNDKVLFSRQLLSKLEAGCHTPFGMHIEKSKIHTTLCCKITYFYDTFNKGTLTNLQIFSERYLPNLNTSHLDFLINEIQFLPSKINIILCGLYFQNIPQNIAYKNVLCKHMPLIITQSISSSNLEQPESSDVTFICSQTAIKSINKLPVSKFYICIGKKTELALKQKFQISNNSVLSEQGSYEMVSAFLKKHPNNIKSAIWIGAKNGKKEAIKLLQKNNISVIEILPYQTKTKYLSDNEKKIFAGSNKSKSYIVFSSPSCVHSYVKNNLYSTKHILCCIGNTTAKEVILQNMFPHILAQQNSLTSIINSILQTKDTPPTINFTKWSPSILK